MDGLLRTDTATAQALRQPISLNCTPLAWKAGIRIADGHVHNLKHINVTVPKGVLTAVTGVAGSGKSSLARYELVKRCPEAIVIDQKPIGTSIRSTPATYTGVMDEIRKLFAKVNGVAASWFSFNSRGGCPICKGTGQISYEMAFAEPVVVVCEECGGHRYNPTALGSRYKGRNIEEVMALTIEQAMDFFDSGKIRTLLQSMLDVGLGYLKLGQPTSTLSGGEVQRVKLASELHKTGSVYALDERSTGLHARDLDTLLSLLRKLVVNGNTVVMVEHHPELIAQADWIIDMGPEGGSDGGEVVFTGTPMEIVRRPVHAHGSLRMPLYHVAGLCNELDLPFLSTLVTLKYQPKNARAGEGFYKMACEFRPEYRSMEPAEVWETERQRLMNCKDWSRLNLYLKRAGW